MTKILVKICGLTTAESLKVAVDAGADAIGLVFYPKSPRNISVELAASLRALVPSHIHVVAVTVNADDALLTSIAEHVKPDFVQLHGDETTQRIQAIRARFPFKLIKTVAISSAKDLTAAPLFEPYVEALLFDAKPPSNEHNSLPGGNGLAFDWALLAGQIFNKPWFLSGGLHAGNVQAALQASGASAVDVSSGVESAPGIKSNPKIKEFIRAATT